MNKRVNIDRDVQSRKRIASMRYAPEESIEHRKKHEFDKSLPEASVPAEEEEKKKEEADAAKPEGVPLSKAKTGRGAPAGNG